MHDDKKQLCKDSGGDVETAPDAFKRNEIVPDSEEREPTSKGSLIKNWPLMSSIIVYCIFSLHDMAYTEVFPEFNFIRSLSVDQLCRCGYPNSLSQS